MFILDKFHLDSDLDLDFWDDVCPETKRSQPKCSVLTYFWCRPYRAEIWISTGLDWKCKNSLAFKRFIHFKKVRYP